MKLRVWIVDDEPLARRGLREMLAAETDLEVAGESVDGPSAVEAIRAHEPDLVLLDVQMPGLDGFEVLERLEPSDLPMIVFVTAYDAYALRAFEAHAIDYLLKPIDESRLRAAVARARAAILGTQAEEIRAKLRALLDGRDREDGAGSGSVRRILIRSAGSVQVVPVEEIDWIRSDGDYARLRTESGEHLLRETLQSLERRLDPAAFVRVHRSYLVRVDRVRKVRTLENGDAVAILEDGTELPVSRGSREALLRALAGSSR